MYHLVLLQLLFYFFKLFTSNSFVKFWNSFLLSLKNWNTKAAAVKVKPATIPIVNNSQPNFYLIYLQHSTILIYLENDLPDYNIMYD